MLITREKLIEVDGKKEKVSVSFDIPSSLFKTKEEIEEECGDIGLEDKTSEQVLDEAFGAVCNSLANYLVATLHCGHHSGEALMVLQNSVLDSGVLLGRLIRDWKESVKMR